MHQPTYFGIALMCMLVIIIAAVARGCMGKEISRFSQIFTQHAMLVSMGVWIYCVLYLLAKP